MYRRTLDRFKRLFAQPIKVRAPRRRPVFSTEGGAGRYKAAVEKISYIKGNTKTLHGRHGRGLDYSRIGTLSERWARAIEAGE